MSLRLPIIRILRNSRIVFGTCEPVRASRLVYLNLIGSVDKPSCTLTRCYSEDGSRNNKSFPQPKISEKKETIADDDTLEIFDLEEERNKLHKASNLSKYEEFKDEDSQLILDVEEEKIFSRSSGIVQPKMDEFDGASLERGIRGVFDVTELVSVLKQKSAQEIAVIEMPVEIGYADHMIIVTGKSTRHLKALADYIRRLYKQKMHANDKIPAVEGAKNRSDEWLALDLGNIILHIFSKRTREVYDLESLWTLGPEFDPHLNAVEDPLDAIISKHSSYLADLEPADKTS